MVTVPASPHWEILNPPTCAIYEAARGPLTFTRIHSIAGGVLQEIRCRAEIKPFEPVARNGLPCRLEIILAQGSMSVLADSE
jgi:hypothetical protein